MIYENKAKFINKFVNIWLWKCSLNFTCDSYVGVAYAGQRIKVLWMKNDQRKQPILIWHTTTNTSPVTKPTAPKYLHINCSQQLPAVHSLHSNELSVVDDCFTQKPWNIPLHREAHWTLSAVDVTGLSHTWHVTAASLSLSSPSSSPSSSPLSASAAVFAYQCQTSTYVH